MPLDSKGTGEGDILVLAVVMGGIERLEQERTGTLQSFQVRLGVFEADTISCHLKEHSGKSGEKILAMKDGEEHALKLTARKAEFKKYREK